MDINKKCIRCGLDNSFITHPDQRYCIRCGEKLSEAVTPESEERIKLLSPMDVCRLLGIQKTTLYQYVHRNQIPYLKFGKNLRFEENAVINYLNTGREKTE